VRFPGRGRSSLIAVLHVYALVQFDCDSAAVRLTFDCNSTALRPFDDRLVLQKFDYYAHAPNRRIKR